MSYKETLAFTHEYWVRLEEMAKARGMKDVEELVKHLLLVEEEQQINLGLIRSPHHPKEADPVGEIVVPEEEGTYPFTQSKQD